MTARFWVSAALAAVGVWYLARTYRFLPPVVPVVPADLGFCATGCELCEYLTEGIWTTDAYHAIDRMTDTERDLFCDSLRDVVAAEHARMESTPLADAALAACREREAVYVEAAAELAAVESLADLGWTS